MKTIKRPILYLFGNSVTIDAVSRLIFIIFVLAVVGGYLFYAPGWGFMDDLNGRQLAETFWSSKASFISLVLDDVRDHGRFRPVYYVWIVLVYWLKFPLVIYILVFLVGAWMLLLWGQLLSQSLFEEAAPLYVKWVFPLGFFLFPAFWNIFMYISVQEKFVFIFGTLSLVVLFKSYRETSLRHLIMALLLAMVAMLGKETGVVFFLTYAVYGICDLVLFKRNERFSRVLLTASLVIGTTYMVFIKRILGGYTATYKTGLNTGTLLSHFFTAPGFIKLVVALCLISLLIFIWDTVRGRKLYDSLCIVFPIWVLIYIFLLLPWGFPAYLLAPLGPFIMACVYFLVLRLVGQRPQALRLMGIVVMIGAMLTLAMDILPKISKMADKRKVVEAMKYLNQGRSDRFFYPNPYEETANHLRGYSSAQVIYTDKINASSLENGQKNYLIINDEASPIILDGVDISQEVYHNGTWGIWLLQKDPGVHKNFRLLLPQNLLQKVKNIIRRA